MQLHLNIMIGMVGILNLYSISLLLKNDNSQQVCKFVNHVIITIKKLNYP
jgi:hypothetical protein